MVVFDEGAAGTEVASHPRVLAVGVAVRIGVDVVVRIGGRVAPQAGQLRIERVGAAPDLDLITDRGDDRVVEAAV